MSLDLILKDVNCIYGRLLDHRPVLNGEIRFMLKEFEEKRNGRDDSRLNMTMVNTSIVEKDTLPQALVELQQNLGPLLEKVNACSNLSKEIEALEEDNKNKDWLVQQRASRDQEWRDFMQEQCEKSSNVDEGFKGAKEKLEAEYAELDQALKVPSSP